MAQARLKSLRTRFLMLLALGGSIVASVGLWITYTTTVGDFETQLIERGTLLADTHRLACDVSRVRAYLNFWHHPENHFHSVPPEFHPPLFLRAEILGLVFFWQFKFSDSYGPNPATVAKAVQLLAEPVFG